VSGFLLDTNVPSELVRPQPEPKVKAWLAAQDLDTLFISSTVTAANLKEVIRQNVEPATDVMTDETGVYDFLGKEFGRHSTVNHRDKEYARREDDGTVASVNTVEGFFSLLKRGVYGSFHHISKQHLHRYLSEFDFRYNTRDVDDGERRQFAIKQVVGKCLAYHPSKVGGTSTLVN
jgi:transposase-like protein